MITKERAVELVENLLVVQQQEQPTLPELAVLDVEEHPLGWLVYWQSADYLRSRAWNQMLVGQGPYLVDRQDGSIHHIPVTTFVGERWEDLYLEQVRGIKPPDPVLSAVREAVLRDGGMAGLRRLRKLAPQLSLREAKQYVDAVRDGGDPAEELTSRTRDKPRHPVFSIDTLAGPIQWPP